MSNKKSYTNKEKYDHPEMGKRIKRLRGKLPQSKYAELLGVTQGTVAKYEKGMMPAADILSRIASQGNVGQDWLLTGERETAVSELPTTYSPKRPLENLIMKKAAEKWEKMTDKELEEEYFKLLSEERTTGGTSST